MNALQMASAVLGALPLVFVFLLAQRQIVEGVAGTGLKAIHDYIAGTVVLYDPNKVLAS